MHSSLLVLLCAVAAVATANAAANLRGLAANSCVGGAAYEVYKANTTNHNLHAIIDYRENVPSLDACAQLCLKAPGCTCAWYAPGAVCIWREDSCATSELFLDAKPIVANTGLISICKKATPAPKPVAGPKPTTPGSVGGKAIVKTWGQCRGKLYKGPSCCGPADRCVEQNVWYSQCLPAGHVVNPGWTGRVLPC